MKKIPVVTYQDVLILGEEEALKKIFGEDSVIELINPKNFSDTKSFLEFVRDSEHTVYIAIKTLRRLAMNAGLIFGAINYNNTKDSSEDAVSLSHFISVIDKLKVVIDNHEMTLEDDYLEMVKPVQKKESRIISGSELAFAELTSNARFN